MSGILIIVRVMESRKHEVSLVNRFEDHRREW